MVRNWVTAAAVALAMMPVSAPKAAGGEEMSSEDLAAKSYNSGLAQRDRAHRFEKKAAEADSERDREKNEAKARKAYTTAVRHFDRAIDAEPDMHEAHSSRGYALRRLGRYADSLRAYNRAIEIEPTYAEAIEYRGQSYLALNRLDDAKAAYMALFADHREYADELMTAMHAWIDARREDPAGLDSAAIDSFAQWVEQRDTLAGQTAGLSGAPARDW